MNTPSPCYKCIHCRYDPLYKDDPADSAYCVATPNAKGNEPQWGNENCSLFQIDATSQPSEKE